MSSNSSSQAPLSRGDRARNIGRTLAVAIAAPAWTLGAVFGAGSLIAVAAVTGGIAQTGAEIDESSALFQLVLSASVYIFGSIVLLVEPYAIRQMSIARICELVGLVRFPVLKDVGYGLVAWAAYMVLTVAVTALVSQYIPGVNLDQDQEIGFTSLSSSLDIFYAFLVIVVAAPFIEELAFRGYLYGTLKPHMRWIIASLITSVLFGVVHGQVNVGIDTFMLSMVLCYLRDKTGSIWSGVFVHALKNSIAFYILFVAPKWLSNLIMGS
ncbi:MAG: CPBP family intramembrane glutamic endopeptidase [Candidatus Saccharimonadales bacterium]